MENPIFRNIQFKPKIWGLCYSNLFGTLGLVAVAIMIFKAEGIITGFSVGIGLGIISYIYFFWNDNIRDRGNEKGKRIRKLVVSYEASKWEVKVR